MKITPFIAALVLLGATGTALATDNPDTMRQNNVAELKRARTAGELDVTDGTYPLQFSQQPSTVTRAQVRAELARALAAGEMNYADATYPQLPQAVPSGLTRQAVLAEAARALAAGELAFGEGASNNSYSQHGSQHTE